MEFDVKYRRRFFGIPLSNKFIGIDNRVVVGNAFFPIERQKIQPVVLVKSEEHIEVRSGPRTTGYGSAASDRVFKTNITLEPNESKVFTCNIGFTSTEMIVTRTK